MNVRMHSYELRIDKMPRRVRVRLKGRSSMAFQADACPPTSRGSRLGAPAGL